MSKITSPILLDSTGQETNLILKQISNSLLAANTLVDDTLTSEDRVWSSKKIVEALTTKTTFSGSSIVCEPIAATPITIKGNVEAGNITLTQTNGTDTIERTVYIPVPGYFNWSTGSLKLEDGNEVLLAAHDIKALNGVNTFEINVGTMELTCNVAGSASGGNAPTWDVIHGGTSTEEV